jgi:hypothetical protein
MRKILVIDTSMLCVWLDVPGKETCGSMDDPWDKERVDGILNKEEEEGTLFVLPLAVIIETGNHIAYSQYAWERANALCEIIKKSIEAASPWVEFAQQDVLWGPKTLRQLAVDWPEYAKAKLSLGDMTIKIVAEFYAEMGHSVKILTGDSGLKAYEPAAVPLVPRRYSDKDRASCK